MKKLNKKSDLSKFLMNGELTQQFLPTETLMQKVLADYNYKISQGIERTKLESLCAYVYSKIRVGDKDFCSKYRFMRSAKEVWESKLATGCTDYALIFATFARQLGYPTTILHTAELNWLKNLQEGKPNARSKNHTFCECYYDGEWILVDPTFRKITKNYDPNKLELDYEVANSNIYVPYKRCIDPNVRQTTSEHMAEAEKICKNLK